MHKLAQIYMEHGHDLIVDLIRLRNIFKDHRMNQQDIHNVFQLIKEHQLEQLQWKVEYLRNGSEKAKASNHI